MLGSDNLILGKAEFPDQNIFSHLGLLRILFVAPLAVVAVTVAVVVAMTVEAVVTTMVKYTYGFLSINTYMHKDVLFRMEVNYGMKSKGGYLHNTVYTCMTFLYLAYV